MSKESALEFLAKLESYLNKRLPHPVEMAQQVTAIVNGAKELNANRHMNFPEAAFLNNFIMPALHEYLTGHCRMSTENARQSLLSESFRSLPGIASGTPARSEVHPFSKVVGVGTQQIIERWKKPGRGSVVQSCPDFALRPPSPFKIVFEGKYFSGGNVEKGLADGIYQTFFYRGLPFVPEKPSHPAWDYDYGCFLAYDATPEGSLLDLWNSLDQHVRSSCWDGANIFVMILRGEAGV
ncbi:hypothetical protein [Desulfonatronum parangueonense]